MPPKMPSKKKSRENSPTPTSTTPPGVGGVGWDLADPVATANGIVDKKARNLEKRKNKLITLKQSIETGAKLTPDQEEAVSKLGEVNIQLEMVKDLQKQFTAVTNEYQKLRKRQQKSERQQQKDTEKDNMRKVLGYSFGVYHLLDSIDEVAKEHFAAGSNGAVQLTDTELGNLDSLYRLLAPSRAGNPSYRSDLLLASDHFLFLFDQSSKEVIGTNYKELYELLQKIEACEYFDKPHDDEEEEEEEEDDEEEEEEDEVEREPEVSHDDHVTAQPVAEVTVVDHVTYDGGYQDSQPRGRERDLASGGSGYIPQPSLPATQEPLAPPSPATQPPIMEYMPASVPSPTFPGLEGGGQQAIGTDDGFSFMHESEVTRPVPTATVQPTHISTLPPSLPPSHSQTINSAHLHQPLSQYNPSYNHPPQSNTSPHVKGVKVIDGSYQSNTDATTGQPSPSPFQAKQTGMGSGLTEQHTGSQDFVPSASGVNVGGGSELPLSREPAPNDDGFQQQRSYGNRGNSRGRGGGGWRGGGRGGGQRYGRGGGGGGNNRSFGNQQGGGGGGGYGQSSRGRGYGERRGRPNYGVAAGQQK